MTETATAALHLMVLSPEYAIYERNEGIRENALSGNDGVFYVMDDPTTEANWQGSMYAIVVLAADDPRSAGMWASNAFPGHRAWNVPVRLLTPYVEESGTPEPEGSENGSETPSAADLVALHREGVDVDALTRELADVKAERDRLSLRVAEQRREFEAWKEHATRVAHEYADDAELCEQFDNCMEAIGLPSRRREYVVTINYTVTARNDDDAVEAVSNEYCYTSDLIRYAEVDVEEV